MSSHPDLPPNPREAKYRRAPMPWSGFPVTIVLIAASILVAAVSRIGEDKDRISILFFSEPIPREMWDELAAYQQANADREFSVQREQALTRKFEAHRKRGDFADIREGQIWRLATPVFIHFGFIHLLFNMMWLWDLGRALESRFRALRFALLVLAVSLASNITQAIVSQGNFGGMSGVVYGLFGFVFMRQKFHPAGDVRLNPQIVPFMLIWLVVCFTGAVGPVANGAHVAGLVAGGVIGWVNAMLGGGGAAIKRRREFQRTLPGSDAVLHTCTVCKKTEHDDPNLDFRIGHDGEEYCTDHLPPAE